MFKELVGDEEDENRLCIKVPATWEGLEACQILQARGIPTLATTMFCMEQAALAAEARCTYIAPYVNELRVHFDKECAQYANFLVRGLTKAQVRGRAQSIQLLRRSAELLYQNKCKNPDTGGLAHVYRRRDAARRRAAYHRLAVTAKGARYNAG